MTHRSATQGQRVRLAIVGFGRVGRTTLELALTRPWLEVVTITAHRAERDGELASQTVPGAPGHLRVTTDVAAALRGSRPDVVIIATGSHLGDVRPLLEMAVACGTRAILCTAEELADVEPDASPDGAAIHALAASSDTAIVATGVNPGFVLDLWPMTLSGLAWDVERLEARRVVDVSVFAPHTRRKLGIGYREEPFEAGVSDGSILGHLGFRESLRLLCEAMGRPADRITVETRPVLATRTYRLADSHIEAGTTVGVSQRAQAWRGDSVWVSIELLLHAAPEQDDIRTTDETHLFGRHELHATLEPGAGAILSTAALLINGIAGALRAAPGLYGPGRLPPSAPWLAASAPPMTASRTIDATTDAASQDGAV